MSRDLERNAEERAALRAELVKCIVAIAEMACDHIQKFRDYASLRGCPPPEVREYMNQIRREALDDIKKCYWDADEEDAIEPGGGTSIRAACDWADMKIHMY